MIKLWIAIIIAVVVLIVGLAVGILVGYNRRKAIAEREIGSAEEEARRILNDAIKSAESKKREATVEAKEEILKARNEFEKEIKERRSELQRQENRLNQKEENLDRKTENVEKKEELAAAKLAGLEKEKQEIEAIKRGQLEMLERISGLTAEEAKQYLIDQLEEEVTHDLGVVAATCDRVNIMYGGKIVETGTVDEIFYKGIHPYTLGLLSCVNNPEDEDHELRPIPGSPPDLLAPPAGCPFVDRCAQAMKICKLYPAPETHLSETHKVNCWLTEKGKI